MESITTTLDESTFHAFHIFRIWFVQASNSVIKYIYSFIYSNFRDLCIFSILNSLYLLMVLLTQARIHDYTYLRLNNCHPFFTVSFSK